MSDDENFPDEDVFPKEQRPFDEKLDRESGVFVEPDAREVGCGPNGEPCPPDDFAEDPYSSHAEAVPGTVDDVPLTFGVQLPKANDEHLVADARSHQSGSPAPAEEHEHPEGTADERDLWRQQKALVDEDEASGVDLSGFSDAQVAEIMNAMGDDAADALPDAPGGVSATGEGSEADHGGFPERRE